MGDSEDALRSIGSRATPPNERQQTTLRQTHEEKQAAQQRRAVAIKEEHGAQLEKLISVAGVEDAQIKALAVDRLAHNIAARTVQPAQVSAEDLRRLSDLSLQQAYKIHETQAEKQVSVPSLGGQQRDDPMQGVRLHDSKSNYRELHRTHEQVAAGVNRSVDSDGGHEVVGAIRQPARDSSAEKSAGKAFLTADLQAAKENGNAAKRPGPDRNLAAPESGEHGKVSGKEALASDLREAKENTMTPKPGRDSSRTR